MALWRLMGAISQWGGKWHHVLPCGRVTVLHSTLVLLACQDMPVCIAGLHGAQAIICRQSRAGTMTAGRDEG